MAQMYLKQMYLKRTQQFPLESIQFWAGSTRKWKTTHLIFCIRRDVQNLILSWDFVPARGKPKFVLRTNLYTAERRDILGWEIHPPQTLRFPEGRDFSPRGPRDCTRVKPEGNLEGRGVPNPCTREISRFEWLKAVWSFSENSSKWERRRPLGQNPNFNLIFDGSPNPTWIVHIWVWLWAVSKHTCQSGARPDTHSVRLRLWVSLTWKVNHPSH